MIRHNPLQTMLRSMRYITFLAAISGAALVLLAGCQTPAPESPPPAPVQPPAPPRIDPQLLASLLELADAAMQRQHLAYPEEGSALGVYREILRRQPDQPDALRGLERIVEHFIEQAMLATEHSQFASARSMLARARLILPQHPSIEPTAAQIRLLSQAQRTRVRLTQDDLQAESNSMRNELQDLAVAPQAQQCRFFIRARNDAQGRWIYQTMSEAVPGERLRAQIEIRLPAEVERVCYPI